MLIVSRNTNCDMNTVICSDAATLKEKFISSQNECDIQCANQIIELRQCEIPGFNNDELLTILTFLCTE